MTTMLEVPFVAGVVGSLPRPLSVQDLLPSFSGVDSAEAAQSSRMDDAVKYVIGMQETAGLDLVSDGEWRRHAYTHIIADITGSFEQNSLPGSWGMSVVEPLEVRRPGLIAEEAKFLVEATDKFTKVCIPSPYLLGVRLWHPEASSKAYKTRDEFIEALVPILRDEMIAVRDTGVTVIQIDEPHLCVLVDPKVRSTFEDPQYEMDFAADKINDVVEGIDQVVTALHLCRRNWGRGGWGAEGGYNPIVDTMKKIQVDQYVMEFSIPAAGDIAILKELPEDSLIGLGSVDCRFEHVDTPDEIMGRVEMAMKYVSGDRISLNPDCGFAPAKGWDIPLDEAYMKLKNEAEASLRLREKYG